MIINPEQTINILANEATRLKRLVKERDNVIAYLEAQNEKLRNEIDEWTKGALIGDEVNNDEPEVFEGDEILRHIRERLTANRLKREAKRSAE